MKENKKFKNKVQDPSTILAAIPYICMPDKFVESLSYPWNVQIYINLQVQRLVNEVAVGVILNSFNLLKSVIPIYCTLWCY